MYSGCSFRSLLTFGFATWNCSTGESEVSEYEYSEYSEYE